MKSKILAVVILSVLAISSFLSFEPEKKTPILEATVASPATNPSEKSYPVVAADEAVFHAKRAPAEKGSSPREDLFTEEKNTRSAEQKIGVVVTEDSLEKDPEFLQTGKVSMNLEHVLTREPAFLSENPRAQALIEAGEKVPPEELNFPEGFQLNVLLQPRCLAIADRRLEIENLDENAKELVKAGKPVFVSARLRDRAKGDELVKLLEKEKCVANAGANTEESASQAPYVDEPALAGGATTAFRILQNGGLIDLFNTIDSNMFTTATIGVVDSGVAVDHPDLAGIVAGQADDGGHGTMVAGAAAAPGNGVGTVGAMPFHAQIHSFKVNRPGTTAGKPSDISNGILAAAYANMDVINVSWSGYSTGSYNAAIQIAVNEGSFVTGSAGNFGRKLRSNATIEGAVSVGALNGTNPSVASYSNYGPGAEIYTPGTIFTTTMSGDYRMATGTSFAAPQVGGVALMMKAFCKVRGADIAPARIEQLLKQTTVAMSGRRGEYQKMHALNAFSTMRETGC